MVWQLKYAGVFHQIKGLIVGSFSNIKDNSTSFGSSIENIILEKSLNLVFQLSLIFPRTQRTKM